MYTTSPRALVRPRWRSVPAVIATYGDDTLYATLSFFLAALRGRLPGRLVQTLRVSFANGSGFRRDDLLCYAVGVLLAATIDAFWLRAGYDRRAHGR